jgi:hypothetical protein
MKRFQLALSRLQPNENEPIDGAQPGSADADAPVQDKPAKSLEPSIRLANIKQKLHFIR